MPIFAIGFNLRSLSKNSFMSVGHVGGEAEADVLDGDGAARQALARPFRNDVVEEDRELQALEELGDVLVGFGGTLDLHLAPGLLERVEPNAARVPARVETDVGIP